MAFKILGLRIEGGNLIVHQGCDGGWTEGILTLVALTLALARSRSFAMPNWLFRADAMRGLHVAPPCYSTRKNQIIQIMRSSERNSPG